MIHLACFTSRVLAEQFQNYRTVSGDIQRASCVEVHRLGGEPQEKNTLHRVNTSVHFRRCLDNNFFLDAQLKIKHCVDQAFGLRKKIHSRRTCHLSSFHAVRRVRVPNQCAATLSEVVVVPSAFACLIESQLFEFCSGLHGNSGHLPHSCPIHTSTCPLVATLSMHEGCAGTRIHGPACRWLVTSWQEVWTFTRIEDIPRSRKTGASRRWPERNQKQIPLWFAVGAPADPFDAQSDVTNTTCLRLGSLFWITCGKRN